MMEMMMMMMIIIITLSWVSLLINVCRRRLPTVIAVGLLRRAGRKQEMVLALLHSMVILLSSVHPQQKLEGRIPS